MQVGDELIAHGTSAYYADLVVNLFATMRQRHITAVHDDIRNVLGRPAISFSQFAQGYAGELARQVA